MNTPSNAGKEIVHLYPRDENLAIFGCTSLFYEWTLDAWAAWAYESGVAILPHRSMTEALANDPRNPDNSTPPTQSQEGETVVDTAHKQFHAQDEYAHHPGVSLEFARNLHSRLTAAQRENDRLRSEVAVLDEIMKGERIVTPVNKEHATWMYRTAFDYLKAARAATEEGKRG